MKKLDLLHGLLCLADLASSLKLTTEFTTQASYWDRGRLARLKQRVHSTHGEIINS